MRADHERSGTPEQPPARPGAKTLHLIYEEQRRERYARARFALGMVEVRCAGETPAQREQMRRLTPSTFARDLQGEAWFSEALEPRSDLNVQHRKLTAHP